MDGQTVTEKGADYAWGNCRSANCSLAAWVFRISCHVGPNSHCPGRRGDHVDPTFSKRQIRRVEGAGSGPI